MKTCVLIFTLSLGLLTSFPLYANKCSQAGTNVESVQDCGNLQISRAKTGTCDYIPEGATETTLQNELYGSSYSDRPLECEIERIPSCQEAAQGIGNARLVIVDYVESPKKTRWFSVEMNGSHHGRWMHCSWAAQHLNKIAQKIEEKQQENNDAEIVRQATCFDCTEFAIKGAPLTNVTLNDNNRQLFINHCQEVFRQNECCNEIKQLQNQSIGQLISGQESFFTTEARDQAIDQRVTSANLTEELKSELKSCSNLFRNATPTRDKCIEYILDHYKNNGIYEHGEIESCKKGYFENNGGGCIELNIKLAKDYATNPASDQQNKEIIQQVGCDEQDYNNRIKDSIGKNVCNFCIDNIFNGSTNDLNSGALEACQSKFLTQNQPCCGAIQGHFAQLEEFKGPFYSTADIESKVQSYLQGKNLAGRSAEQFIGDYNQVCKAPIAEVTTPDCATCNKLLAEGNASKELQETCEQVYRQGGKKAECTLIGAGDSCQNCIDKVLTAYRNQKDPSAQTLADIRYTSFDELLQLIKDDQQFSDSTQADNTFVLCLDEMTVQRSCCAQISGQLNMDAIVDKIRQGIDQAQNCQKAITFMGTLKETCADFNPAHQEAINNYCATPCPSQIDGRKMNNFCCMGVLNAKEDGLSNFGIPVKKPNLSNEQGASILEQFSKSDDPILIDNTMVQCQEWLSDPNSKALSQKTEENFNCTNYARLQMTKAIMVANGNYNAPANYDEFLRIFKSDQAVSLDDTIDENGRLGENFKKWYAEQATTNMGRCPEGSQSNECTQFREQFCNYPLNEETSRLFCDEQDIQLVKELYQQYCSGKSLCELCTDSTNTNPPSACNDAMTLQKSCCNQAQADDKQGRSCDEIKQQPYWNIASNTLSPDGQPFNCPLSCDNKESEGQAQAGPCESIANLNDKIVGPTGKIVQNPFLLEENGEFIAETPSALAQKSQYIAEGKQSYSGSIYNEHEFFTQCQKMASTDWGTMVAAREDGAALDALWSLSWAAFTQGILEDYAKMYRGCKEIEEELKRCDNPQRDRCISSPTLQEIVANAKADVENQKYLLDYQLDTPNGLQELHKTVMEKAQQHLIKVRTCTALVQMTAHTDYSDPEAGDKKKKASADSSIQCTRKGALTQDYQGCDDLITAYDAALLAEQALIAGQQIHFQGKQAEFQRELASDEDNVKGPIRLQKKTLTEQRNYANVQGGGHAAKVVALEAAIGNIPTMEVLLEECTKNYYKDQGHAGHKDYAFIIGKLFNSSEIYSPDGTINHEAIQSTYPDSYWAISGDTQTLPICINTIKENSGLHLIANDVGRSQGHTAAIQAGIKSAEQFMIADVIKKNIDYLDKLLNDIEDFKPEDLNYTIEDLVAQECEANPTLPACSGTLEGTDTQVGFVGQSFSVGSSGRSGTGDYTLPEQSGLVTDTATSSGTLGEGTKFAPIDTGNQGSRSLASTVGRGSVKSNIGSGSSGSGGGSARSVSAPSGGASRSSAATPRSRYQSKDYSYSGKSRGITYGSGSSSRSKSSSSNPFAKLFNKSAQGKKAVVNFRDLASKGEIGTQSGRNLFKMISDRYDSVEDKKLLLEYQKVE